MVVVLWAPGDHKREQFARLMEMIEELVVLLKMMKTGESVGVGGETS